ncbi:MAG: SCO1 protein [Anaerolineales bacterium]|nr:SCO1 protein [Anaerolineales bacterium]
MQKELHVKRFARAIPLTVLLLALVAAGCSLLPASKSSFRGTALEPIQPAPDFTLTTQDNTTYHLSDQRGDAVLVFFGYTYCPDVCPTTLAEFKKVHDALGAEVERVDFVFVTVDPERDTPERLKQHLRVFDPSFIGLTGDFSTLESVWQDYGVYRKRAEAEDSAAGYLMDHSSAVYLIDPDGNLRLTYSFGTDHEAIVHDIRELLKRS